MDYIKIGILSFFKWYFCINKQDNLTTSGHDICLEVPTQYRINHKIYNENVELNSFFPIC